MFTNDDVIIGDWVDTRDVTNDSDDVTMNNISFEKPLQESLIERGEFQGNSTLNQPLAKPRLDEEEYMDESSLFKSELDLGCSEIGDNPEPISKLETPMNDGEDADTSVETSWLVKTQEPESTREENVLQSTSQDEQNLIKSETNADQYILGSAPSNCNIEESMLDEISAEIEQLSERNQSTNSQTLQKFICVFCLTHLETAGELNNHVLVFHSSYR